MDTTRHAYVTCRGCSTRPVVQLENVYPDGSVYRTRCPACEALIEWPICAKTAELFRLRGVRTVDQIVGDFYLDLEDERSLWRLVYGGEPVSVHEHRATAGA